MHGNRAGRLGQAGLDDGLAGGRLALTGHQHVAEIDFVDLLGLDAGLFDGGLDGHGAQITCRQVGKVALERAHGGALGANDDNGFSHFKILLRLG